MTIKEIVELVIQERLSLYFKKNDEPGMARMKRSDEFLALLKEKNPDLAEEFNAYLDWIAALIISFISRIPSCRPNK